MLTFEAALTAAGVTPASLHLEHEASLDNQGFVLLPRALDESWLARLRRSFEEQAGTDAPERGTRYLMVSRGLVDFDAWLALANNPQFLAAAWQILGRPFRLADLRGRSPRPAYGAEGLRTDCLTRRAGEPPGAATAIWMLDDLNALDGAPRVVPGTHLTNRPIPKPLSQPGAHHPDEQIISGPAGSLLVLNGHIWHSGTRNRGAGPSRTIEMIFVGAENRRAYRHIEDANWGRLVKNQPWIPPAR
jgi:hypothetical protein